MLVVCQRCMCGMLLNAMCPFLGWLLMNTWCEYYYWILLWHCTSVSSGLSYSKLMSMICLWLYEFRWLNWWTLRGNISWMASRWYILLITLDGYLREEVKKKIELISYIWWLCLKVCYVVVCSIMSSVHVYMMNVKYVVVICANVHEVY